jgi:hypothetical protein
MRSRHGSKGEAVRASQVFIALLTPKWFESPYCRKEYETFQEVEAALGSGQYYVVPLLARALDSQLRNFDHAQSVTYDSLRRRQYKKIIAADFLTWTENQHDHFVDKIADDVEGMIERLRGQSSSPAPARRATPPGRVNRTYEFTANSLNAVEVDFVSAAEILVEPRNGGARRGVFVDLAFVERLHVETSGLRVEFSLRQAFLSIDDGGTGKLERNPDWARFAESSNIYYVTYKPVPQAITVCVTPPAGRTGISALPLPPAEHENHLSKPAIAAPEIDIGNIRAELRVSLSPDGLFIAGEDSRKPSTAFYNKIAAISAVYAGKDRRPIRVRERTS